MGKIGNKGDKDEVRNAMDRAVFFNRLGELRDQPFENDPASGYSPYKLL
jgi:hypothetical protein